MGSGRGSETVAGRRIPGSVDCVVAGGPRIGVGTATVMVAGLSPLMVMTGSVVSGVASTFTVVASQVYHLGSVVAVLKLSPSSSHPWSVDRRRPCRWPPHRCRYCLRLWLLGVAVDGYDRIRGVRCRLDVHRPCRRCLGLMYRAGVGHRMGSVVAVLKLSPVVVTSLVPSTASVQVAPASV